MAHRSRRDNASNLTQGLAVALIVTCLLFGGTSQAAAYSQFFVRAGTILIGAAVLLRLDKAQLGEVRTPLLLCLAWTALMLVQLIPLPPGLWTALPGRAPFVELADLIGIAQPWRPLSLVPEATVDSALSMIVPLAVLVAVSQLPSHRFPVLLTALVLLVLLSGLIGVAQVAGGGSVYFYEISNRGDAVGLFANRNHQAALLAASVPLLAVLANLADLRGEGGKIGGLAYIVFVLIFPLVFVTGSRSGLALLLVGVALAGLITIKARRSAIGVRNLLSNPLVGLGVLAIIAAGAALVFFRVGSVDRMINRNVEEDLRVELFGDMVAMAGKYFPVGGGFGTFPSLFKIDEPFASLSHFYLNHAHNDLLEIVIEGGVAAVVIAILALAWAAAVSVRLWRTPLSSEHPQTHLTGLAASSILLILLLASVSDYPLRTSSLAGVAALAAALLAKANRTLFDPAKMIPRSPAV